MNEYNKGFQDAIDKVILLLREEAEKYATLKKESPCTCKKFHDKALAVIDCRLLIYQLFKEHVMVDGTFPNAWSSEHKP